MNKSILNIMSNFSGCGLTYTDVYNSLNKLGLWENRLYLDELKVVKSLFSCRNIKL